jgi:hypothetical protein
MMSCMPMIDALDRVNEVTMCLEAYSDLSLPRNDLALVDREKNALLLQFLLTELRLSQLRLEAEIKALQGK